MKRLFLLTASLLFFAAQSFAATTIRSDRFDLPFIPSGGETLMLKVNGVGLMAPLPTPSKDLCNASCRNAMNFSVTPATAADYGLDWTALENSIVGQDPKTLQLGLATQYNTLALLPGEHDHIASLSLTELKFEFNTTFGYFPKDHIVSFFGGLYGDFVAVPECTNFIMICTVLFCLLMVARKV